MRQSDLLLETLKRYLRHQGVSYKELAKRLGQSESNIKRIFSERSISLVALEEMCGAVELELLELAKMSRPGKEDAPYFTRTQEDALAKDPKLFAFCYLIIQELTLPQILARYQFMKIEAQRYLLKMDKLELIRLHANDRVEVLVSRNVRWLETGPLSVLYAEEIKKEFMKSDFSKVNERLRFLNARLSKNSIQVLSRRLDRLLSEFVSLAEIDEVGGADKTEFIWFVLAYRPWAFSVITKLRRRSSV